ncbi:MULTISPECIES: DUF86 domain-containing protein [unclassified Thioalkalivibrio]|uniref:type VII toxin-antitoxin system HepT family RNase toxin n=1 Tax=unclassified Thioalkalivibrio TaxID=2621013 RepID=UPI0003814339|nr:MULTISPECIES: DUF86 domain-containing protein [unclassified Thioalkalivibrio]
MQLELYLQEVRHLAGRQRAVLDEAAERLEDGGSLSPLEENGVLHALQVLAENAIGKAKHMLKAAGQPVPVSAHDAFQALAGLGFVDPAEVPRWNAIVGIRNRIVHDYLNLDIGLILELVRRGEHQFIHDFLVADLPESLRPRS